MFALVSSGDTWFSSAACDPSMWTEQKIWGASTNSTAPNCITGRRAHRSLLAGDPSVWTEQGLGRKYRKALYRAYTDGSFQVSCCAALCCACCAVLRCGVYQ